jgi:subtilisin family serine protease
MSTLSSTHLSSMLEGIMPRLNKKDIQALGNLAAAALAPPKAKPRRYILLPANQVQATSGTGNPEVASFLQTLSVHASSKKAVRLAARTATSKKNTSIHVHVVDSIHENGAKLITIDDTEMANFRFSYPGLRIIPEKFYHRAFRYEPRKSSIRMAGTRAATKFTTTISITDTGGKALSGIFVVAFTDFAARIGASGTTNASGSVSLTLASKNVERVYVYPDHSYWGFFQKSFVMAATMNIQLKPIDLAFDDSLRHFYPTRTWPAIPANVRVGIIDTGFGPHKDVAIISGRNMVTNESPAEFSDQEGHGTHVAGIVAAHGLLPGVAQGVELCIYRVFPTGGSASNYDIMKAIDQAKTDGCDLVNMSLGGGELDEGIISAVKDAYNAGMICFAANGNDDRAEVSFPARYSLCIAVSAMGRKGCFPPQTVQSGIVHAPFGKPDKANFIADFSNIGSETDLTAPGVGIISTYPNDLYAVMDGTSMACPAAVGMAARLLSSQPTLLQMPRSQARADEIQKFLATKIKSLGFGATFEGKGILFP